MKKFICVLLILAALISLCACMGIEKKKKDITIVTYNIPVNDFGIGSKYIEGLKMIGNEASLSYFENLISSEFSSNLNKIAEENHDFIFLVQPYGYDELIKVAKAHPELSFGISDITDDKPLASNITSITFKYHEGTYIAGFIAGKSLRTSKKIGILTETEEPYVKKYVNAFKAGALSADNTIEFEDKILGIDYTAEDARKAAEELYDNGCDTVFQDLYRPEGAIEAADAKGKYTIGLGIDQSVKSSNAVLTTVTASYDIAFSEVLGKFVTDTDIGGKTFDFGIGDFAVSISKTTKNINKDVLSEANKISDSIFNGNFAVPTSEAELEALRNAPANGEEEAGEDKSAEDSENGKNEE